MIIVTNDLNAEEVREFNSKKLSEITEFIQEECEAVSGARTPFRLITISYRKFCERKNYFPVRRSALWQYFKQLGYRQVTFEGRACWLDILPKHVYNVKR